MTAQSAPFQLTLQPRQRGTYPIGMLLALPLLALPFGGWLVESGLLNLARCSFKVHLGIPCMGCGATRGTLNFLHGDLFEGFAFQPFAIAIYITLILWGLISFALYMTNRELDLEMAPWLTWTVRIVLIALPFLNWWYLIARHI